MKRSWQRRLPRSSQSKRSFGTPLPSARSRNAALVLRPHTLMLKKLIQNSPPFLIRYRSWLNAAFQAGLIFLSLQLAWLPRFDFSLPDRLLVVSAAPLLVFIRLAPLPSFRLLHGCWGYRWCRRV